MNPLSETKSADRRAFEHYLRTGERLTRAEWERKFNPYHDELGRFNFAPGSAGMARRPKDPSLPPTLGGTPLHVPPARHRPERQPESRRRAAPEIPGYPETGRTAWRASNDEAFKAAADYYNRKYGLKPDQEEYKTPEFLKAWALRESGGEGDEHAFRTDPFQVNKAGDWVPEKQALIGVRLGQKMTPAASAYSALEWLRYKSYRHDDHSRPVRFLGNRVGLQRYNGNAARTRQSGATPHYVWYADTILQMAAQAATRK